MTQKPTYEELEEKLRSLQSEINRRRKKETTLWRIQERQSQIINNFSIPAFVIDKDHNITHYNKAMENLTGIPADKIIGTKNQWQAFYAKKRYSMADFIVEKATEETIAKYYHGKYQRSLVKEGAYEAEDFFPDIGENGKWIFFTAAPLIDSEGNIFGAMETLQDITHEKRIARNNEAMLRISMALPEYVELYELFDYVSSTIKELVGTEGGVTILLDESHRELFFMGVAYDDTATEERIKEFRFKMDELVAGQVITTGQPMILNDISKDAAIHIERDKRLGYETRNLLLVPLKSQDRVIGVLCAINKKDGDFNDADVELLSMLAGTVVLSIENARFAEEVKKAYMEVSGLNRAKDKVINLLSHELRTPIAVLESSLVTLEKRLAGLDEDSWKSTLARARRNLDRLLEMQYRVHDIMQQKTYRTYDILLRLVAQCTDELEALVAEETGESPVIERIRKRIQQEFGPQKLVTEKIELKNFVEHRLAALKPAFNHREMDVITRFNPAPKIYIPADPLRKIVDGLIKNAIENTPDEGKIEIVVQKKNDGSALIVRDYGVGITEENQSRIYEGFYVTQEMLDYSSKRPFEFNAGGRGVDLLRAKVFSERYHFKIKMKSTRCPFIPKDSDTCPGRISTCPFCKNQKGCHQSPATTFTIHFPPAP